MLELCMNTRQLCEDIPDAAVDAEVTASHEVFTERQNFTGNGGYLKLHYTYRQGIIGAISFSAKHVISCDEGGKLHQIVYTNYMKGHRLARRNDDRQHYRQRGSRGKPALRCCCLPCGGQIERYPARVRLDVTHGNEQVSRLVTTMLNRRMNGRALCSVQHVFRQKQVYGWYPPTCLLYFQYWRAECELSIRKRKQNL